ncbi:MAG TPA: HEAT repeat domain-containing protein [Thermoguttaceae bacterium]|nr:HEAT repeat domain-containing protein [Thermoguttaceae bacterium]
MVCVSGKRVLRLFCCLLALTMAGCSANLMGWSSRNGLEIPDWMSFRKKPKDELTGILSPSERIEKLRKMAGDARRNSPDQKGRISLELCESIRTEEDPMIRAEIIRTLAVYPGAEADRVLEAALDDPEASVRIAACGMWGRRGDAQAVDLLGRVLAGDADTDVRLAAARALGETKNPSAVPALGNVLADRNPAVQYRAVLSLREITGVDLDNNVNHWQQYVKGQLPAAPQPISIAERLRRLF